MKSNQDPTDHFESDSLSPSELAALATYRQSVYGFLAAVFNRLPDAKSAESLTSPDLATFLSTIQAEGLPVDMSQGVQLVEQFVQSAQGKPAADLQTELVVERTRLLRGVRPGYGPPPPYESVYSGSDSAVVVKVLMAVRHSYSEANMALPDDVGEQPDYIGLELEFMRLLTQQEAAAWSGQPDEAQRIVAMERAFLREHLGAWAGPFCDAMLADAQLDFYRGIALMTKGFVIDELSLLDELAGE